MGLAVISLHTKFDMKGNAKCRNWGGLGLGVTQGHKQCHHLIERIQLSFRL